MKIMWMGSLSSAASCAPGGVRLGESRRALRPGIPRVHTRPAKSPDTLRGRLLAVAACALLPLSAGRASALGEQAQPSAEQSAPHAEYVISAGDLLQVVVWKEPDLTRDATVRVDGRITLPLLGDIEAGGRTPAALGQDIAQMLARYVETPIVSVGVAEAKSSRVFVVGQVSGPGEFPLTGPMRFLQALALAGGPSEFAHLDRILIIREGPGSLRVIRVNYKKLEDGSEIEQNVLLRPGDTILVP